MGGTVRRLTIAAVAVVCLALIGGAGLLLLLRSHHAPSAFTLGSSVTPASTAGVAGRWTVAAGSEVGYRAREKFINQPATTEAVARTSKVTGGMQLATAVSSDRVTSIDFAADLASLVSQDKYATYQAYQRDFFVRTIYLQTDIYPKAEFRADPISVDASLAPGPATLTVSGKLMVHGVTKSVTTTMQAQLNGETIEVAGSMSVDMRDFDISPPDISFTKAEPGVVIEYHLVLVRA